MSFAAVLLLAARVVALASDGETAAPPSTPEPHEVEDAQALFRKGVAAYDTHDYVRAIELFRHAYQSSRAPEILFDIGQAYRALGDCRQALGSFDEFIAAVAGDDPLLPRVRSLRQESAACAATEPAPPPKAPVARAEAPPPPSPASVSAAASPASLTDLSAAGPAQRRSIGARFGTPCVATASGALVLGAVGLAFGGVAWSDARTVQRADVWTPDVQRADARGRAFGDASTVVFVSAGLLAVGATAACWLGQRGAHDTPAAGSSP
jgi:hypothetical protein